MIDPFITEILEGGFRISVELVPSMIDREGHPSFEKVMSGVASLCPSFISVTQGAGGTSREQSSPLLRRLDGIPRCAHLICGWAKREEVMRHADDFFALGVRNFLVLKGDVPPGAVEGDYEFASDCIRELRAKYGTSVCIGAGAYPDAHDFDRYEILREKVSAGADFAITQMVFSPDSYARLAREFAIPIIPGTCFLPTRERAEQFSARFGFKLPAEVPSFTKLCESFEAAGAPGVHLFLLNDLALVLESGQDIR